VNMKNKDIKSILQDAVENEYPASQIDLLPRVKERLVAGTIQQQGEKMNTINSRRHSRLALAALAAGALLAVAFITPQGRAFAQSVLQFFTGADRDSFPVQVPEQNPSGPTALPPAALISVAEAEAQAGFDLAELPSVPGGFEYLGARMYGNSVSIEYEALGGGGALILMQSKDGFLQSDWDKVPAEAIVPVEVGGMDAEFAQGTFVVPAGESSAVWNSSAPILRLRWVRDGIWTELTKFGDVEPIEYLDQAGLIALAESMVYEP
jgi:hypothetical protein